MKKLEQISEIGLIPVAVIEDPGDAVPLARALQDGGLPTIEVTLRTPSAMESIYRISDSFPDMNLGAGTVLTVIQAEAARKAGAKFIVSPNFDEEVVDWAISNDIPVFPGCVTPTEVAKARTKGIHTLKFFPAHIFGGLSAMKSIAEPFRDIQFIPTGGINLTNLHEYAMSDIIYAVGGSFLCPKADILAKDFRKITDIVKRAISTFLGFDFKHIGINPVHNLDVSPTVEFLTNILGFSSTSGNSSYMFDSGFEVMREQGLGDKGHLAIGTNSISRAIKYLERAGLVFDYSTIKTKNDRIIAIYLRDQIAGFAIHLLQK